MFCSSFFAAIKKTCDALRVQIKIISNDENLSSIFVGGASVNIVYGGEELKTFYGPSFFFCMRACVSVSVCFAHLYDQNTKWIQI